MSKKKIIAIPDSNNNDMMPETFSSSRNAKFAQSDQYRAFGSELSSERTKNQLDFNFETDVARKIFDFLDYKSIENARLAHEAWRKFLDSSYERRRCLRKLREKYDRAKSQMDQIAKVSYKFFIDHIEERGDIVDIRFMIELFDANIGIGYWFDASKTEEDFDWAFDVFKIQMKTGYDVSYFNSHVRNFLRSNRRVNYSSINRFEQIRLAIFDNDMEKVKRLLVEFLKFLKPKQKSIKTLTEENHPNPLQYAIELKNLEMVKIIIHFKNLEQDFSVFGSYLHLAVEYESLDIFKVIFEATRNRFPTNKEGLTPYDMAKGSFKQELFNYLESKNLPVNF